MQQTDLNDARIIIVDDNPANVELLEHILETALLGILLEAQASRTSGIADHLGNLGASGR